MLQFASLNFDASLWDVVMALVHGATLVIPPPDALSGPPLRALLARRCITHATLPPSVLATIDPGDDLSLEALVVAGEACPEALAARWSAQCRMVNAYGPSESTVCATMSAPLDGASVSIGTPITGVRVYALDAALAPSAGRGRWRTLYRRRWAGARLSEPARTHSGTLRRRSPWPTGRPDVPHRRSRPLAARRRPRLPRTHRPSGQDPRLPHRTRRDRLFFSDQGSIAQAAVVARDDHPAGPYLAAYVVPSPGARIEPAILRQRLAEQLPDYMVPVTFTAIDALPLTPNGKLDRNALPSPDSEGDVQLGGAAALPETPTEEFLADIWRGVLRTKKVSRHSDFFALGGNSLTAIQVAAQIRVAHGLELPLKMLFDFRTLGALGSQIDAALQEQRHTPRLPLIRTNPIGGPAPLSYSQERMWLIQSLDPQNTRQYGGGTLAQWAVAGHCRSVVCDG